MNNLRIVQDLYDAFGSQPAPLPALALLTWTSRSRTRSRSRPGSAQRVATAGRERAGLPHNSLHRPRFGADWTVFSDRVIQRHGIVAKSTSDVQIADLRNVVAHQGILERIFSLGSVGLSTAGQSDFEIRMRGIRGPQKVVRIIQDQRKQQTATPA